MDTEKLLEMEAQCIAEHSPACVAACPFHVDIKAFLAEIKKGNFDGAYKQLEKKVPMANVICRICDHPCEIECLKSKFGGAVSIAMLERTVASMASKPHGDKAAGMGAYKAAVAGGGIMGLCAAVELYKKGFEVHTYEKEGYIGGRLLGIDKNILPEEILKDELEYFENNISKVFKGIIVDDERIKEFKDSYDTVFIAFDKNPGNEWNNVFYGSVSAEGFGNSIIQSAAAGRSAAITMERFLKGISLTASREKEGSYKTGLIVNTEKVPVEEVVKNKENAFVYTKEEAAAEASRCIGCECVECSKACVHLRRYKMTIKKYLRQINHNERLVLGNHFANIMINSCTLCGLCQEVCPVKLDLKKMVKETRESMVERNKMPPSAHDFALRDMEYNNSEEFKMARNEPGFDSSSYVFFPGCQMAASEPEYVEEVYSYLRNNLSGGTGIMLGCCGAPADWAGRAELFKGGIEKIKNELASMGNPKLILACSTCYDIFKRNLDGIEILSIWEIYEKYGLPRGIEGKYRGMKTAIHDACTSRHHGRLQESARAVIKMLGFEIDELEFSGNKAKCCGYGGLALYADKSMAKEFIKERISESALDYTAYCFMCRDLFKGEGKRVYHILDYIYGKNPEEIVIKKGPTISERQQNRKLLKRRLLNNLWGENMNIGEEGEEYKLKLSDEVREKIEDRLILLREIKKVVKNAEESGRKFINPENGHCLSSLNQHHVTYWVEYTVCEDGYFIYNAYSHRMEIMEEKV